MNEETYTYTCPQTTINLGKDYFPYCCNTCWYDTFETEEKDYRCCNIAHARIHVDELNTFFCSKHEVKDD